MSAKIWKYIIFLELLIIYSLSLFAISYESDFKIVACNVGQGDATLIIKGSSQILVDGGPDSRVLECLGKYIPFNDNKIELVILSHPDKDHFMGLIDVFERYQVGTFLRSKATNSSKDYQLLESLVGGKGIKVVEANTHSDMRLGKIYIDIVSPDDFQNNNLDDLKLNDLSVVVVIKYYEFEAILTGDIEIEGINKLVSRGLITDVEYIKIPHHGSKNNITSGLLRLSKPEIAVISVGKNSYGHPNKETLDLLNTYKIPVMRTDEKGDIVIVSKGEDKIINVLE